MKKVLNVFGILLAVFFSLMLIPTLIINPVWQGVSGLLEPEFLENVVSEMVDELDNVEFTFEGGELAGEDLSPELAQALSQSEAVRQIAPLLGEDFTHILMGDFTATSLTAAEIQRIGTAYRAELEELLTLAAKSEGETLSADEASLAIEQLIADADTLESELTAMFLEMQTDLHTEYAQMLALLTGPLVTTALAITALVLSVLIFLCRWPHQEGLLWLGIDFALAALPVLGISVSLKGAQISQALSAGIGMPNVFSPVLRQAGNSMLLGGAILLALAVVFVAGFMLLRDRRMKQEAAQQADMPVPPTAPGAQPWELQ